MGTTKLSRKIELDLGYLFGKWDKPTELIVFNPPWLPASHDLDDFDRAIYYATALFPEFFAEAKRRLLPEGKLLFIFSTVAQVIHATINHPVHIELADGGSFKLERCVTKAMIGSSNQSKQDARYAEKVELWE